MNRSEIIDYIKAFGSKFLFGSLANYETIPTTADLEDADIPAWKNIKDYSPAVIYPVILNKSVVSLLAAGQPVTFFIDISVYPQFDNTATILTLASDGTGKLQTWSDMAVIQQDTVGDGTGDFTGWNVTGHSIDGSTLSDDLTIIIKQ
jgi:hypothetical protein